MEEETVVKAKERKTTEGVVSAKLLKGTTTGRLVKFIGDSKFKQ